MPDKFNRLVSFAVLSALSASELRDKIEEYDREFDVLDDQGRMNASQIQAQLVPKYFGCSLTSEQFANLRRKAVLKGVPEIRGISDTVAKILEPRQQSLFDEVSESPSKTNVNEMLAPKSEEELNYEDFEAAFRVMQADGGRFENVTFDTVVRGRPATVSVPWIVATILVKARARSARVISLLQQMRPDVPVE